MNLSHRAAARVPPLLGATAMGVTGRAGAPTASAPDTSPGSFTIQDYQFPAMTAAPGATITLVDGDSEPHTVTADDAGFDSGTFDSSAPGKLIAPPRPGTYPIHCTVHPSMHGSLTVY